MSEHWSRFRKLQLPLPTLLLVAVNVAIATCLLMAALGGMRGSELLATRAKPVRPLGIELKDSPPPVDLAAIQSQPLMHATRAYFAAPAVDTVTAPPLPAYRLAGSFLSPGKAAVAMLVNPQDGATWRVRSGDVVDGWRVEVIDGRRVVLSWNDQKREIASTAVPASTALRRMPLQRQRVAAAGGGTVTLGAAGPGAIPGTQFVAPQSELAGVRPRVRRPPVE